MNNDLIKGSTIIIILSILEKEDLYGYGLIKEIDKQSNGLFKFKEGTLYPLLHTLEEKKLIESYWEKKENSRKRKYYKITKRGKVELIKRKESWEIFSETLNTVLGGTINA